MDDSFLRSGASGYRIFPPSVSSSISCALAYQPIARDVTLFSMVTQIYFLARECFDQWVTDYFQWRTSSASCIRLVCIMPSSSSIVRSSLENSVKNNPSLAVSYIIIFWDRYSISIWKCFERNFRYVIFEFVRDNETALRCRSPFRSLSRIYIICIIVQIEGSSPCKHLVFTKRVREREREVIEGRIKR